MESLTNEYTATSELIQLYRLNENLYNEDSPVCMNRLRESAIENFERLAIPSTKFENYKYTDLQPAFQNDFSVQPKYVKQEIDLHDVFNCDVPKLETHLVLLINGWYYARNRKVGNLPEGVICGSLQHVASEHPELVEKFYGKLADVKSDALIALNSAFAKDGLFIYVPDNTVIEKPIQIINLMKSDENLLGVQRNLIILGKNCEAKVVFCDHTLNNNYYISSNVTECFVGEDARLGFYTVQNQNNGAVNLNTLIIDQAAKSNVQTSTITLNGGLVRNNLNVLLNGEYADTSISGLTLSDKKQHVDNFTIIEHRKPNCTSNQLYKNVLDENSTGVFSGRIHVLRDAQKTAAFQRNNNVLLSETAQIKSKPQLIIDADDVKCSHGATTGRINDEALFYMRARGISETEARLMLMFAFADEVISTIKVEPLKLRIEELVDRRLRGELSPCSKCALGCN